MISHSLRFVFFHVPKAAGSSIQAFLRQRYPGETILNSENQEFQRSLDPPMQFPNHAPCRVMARFLGAENYARYFKFAFVRNPFERLVSLYFYTLQVESELAKSHPEILNDFNQTIMSSKSFDSWVTEGNALGGKQWDFLSIDGQLAVDFVGRTESVETDFQTICMRLGIEYQPLGTKNSSEHDHYSQYYSPDSRRIVEEYFREDLKRFGYEYAASPVRK